MLTSIQKGIPHQKKSLRKHISMIKTVIFAFKTFTTKQQIYKDTLHNC